MITLEPESGKGGAGIDTKLRDKVTSELFDEEGNLFHARAGRIELSRSGAAKVLTSYMGGSPVGGAFIYHLEGNELTIVSGMLSDRASLPRIQLLTFRKVSANESAE